MNNVPNQNGQRNNSSRGGQASLTLFGVPGVGRYQVAAQAKAQSQADTSLLPRTEGWEARPIPTEARERREAAERASAVDRRVRNAWLKKGSPLTPEEEEAARNPPKMTFGKPAAPAAPVPAAVPPGGSPSPVIAALTTPASDFPVLLRLRGDRFQVFARLADRERRPVEEVMLEWMSDCARLIQDADLFGEDAPPPPRISNAMMMARYYSEQRESGVDRSYEPDAYEFYQPQGHFAEVQLALD